MLFSLLDLKAYQPSPLGGGIKGEGAEEFLFHRDEEIVLLAFLQEEVLAIDEVVGGDHLVECRQLLFVEAHAAAFDELAHLTLGGEDVPAIGTEKVDSLSTELGLREVVVRHILEDIVECCLVEPCQLVFGSLSEEDVGSRDSHVKGFLGVDESRHLLSEPVLEDTASRVLLVLLCEILDGLLVEIGEDLDVPLSILVAHVEPELIKSIGCGTVRIEPYVSALCLAKLLTVGLGDKRAGEAERLCIIAEGAADELCTCRHVTPLVVTAELQAYAIVLIEIEEVVSLEKLISELRERQTVAGSTVEALLHALLSHHIVDRDVLADVAHEVEELIVLHPVVVVDQLSLVRLVAIEVEELRHLLLDSLLIVVERVTVEEVTLEALAGRVTNHTRSATDEEERLVAAALQMAQHHDAAQMADMK